MNSLPKSRVIIGYNDFFPEQPLESHLDLLQGMSKKEIIAEIAGLNYRLKPKDHLLNDYTLATQDRELFYFCGANQQLYRKYGRLARQFVRPPADHPLIFTRQTCLFAMEEILAADIPVIGGFTMANSWEKLLQYLLAVNSVVAAIRQDNREQTTDDKQTDAVAVADENPLSFEDINVRILVLNELNIGSDQIYLPSRALQFLSYMTAHEQLGQSAVQYIYSNYGGDYRRFVFDILSLYVANNAQGKNNFVDAGTGLPIDTTFVYYTTPDTKPLFVTLSQSIESANPEKLLSVRKYPFYNAGDAFYLLDNTFLIDKTYGQFINDFWFDAVKDVRDERGRPLFDIRYYRAAVGAFFERYVEQRFRYMTANARHFKIKALSELLLQVRGQQIEFTDVYIRYDKRVFLGEVKATGIYDKERYSGDLNEFYRQGREAFFDSFGMQQVVNAVNRLKQLVHEFDPGFPARGRVKVFPAVIINEKALQTPLMAQVFNNRFRELMADTDLAGIDLAPLAVMHVSDLETMEGVIHQHPPMFWKILERHAANRIFMPPFYHTLNQLRIKADYNIPEKDIRKLIDEFNPQSV